MGQTSSVLVLNHPNFTILKIWANVCMHDMSMIVVCSHGLSESSYDHESYCTFKIKCKSYMLHESVYH